MKKRFIPLAATAMLFGVPGALAQTDTQSPATTSPSQPSGADQSGAAAPSTSASGAAATATAAAGAQAVDTQTFVQAATSSNMLEIESSRLALERGVADGVQDFAEQMVADHTKAGEEMKGALEEVDMTAATSDASMLPRHQQMLDTLKATEGEAFDQAYVDMQVAAHEEAVALFSAYASGGEQDALKAFAEKTLPTLQEHERHIKEIDASIAN